MGVAIVGNKYSPPTALAIVLDGEYPESPKSNSLRNLIGSTCGSMGQKH
ncbi:MAG: hypothetical protein J7K21_04155 [Desulfurococcales archaeon]|nr:hypothetical protein [Desulfurococcales archaeon]